MSKKVTSRLDALALALGGVSVAGSFGALPFGALPLEADDRINAAWDAKLRAGKSDDCSKPGPDCANAGWVT